MRKQFVTPKKKQMWAANLASILKDYFWVRYLLTPILTTLPPAVAIACTKAAINEKSHFLIKLISEHQIWVHIVAALYLIIATSFLSYIYQHDRSKEEIDTKGLLTLFEVLERIVGGKSRRFGEFYKTLETFIQANGRDNIFSNITQPDIQIKELIQGLYAFFDAIDKDDVSFRISVATIKDGVPTEWFYHLPESEPPSLPIEALTSPESSISHCLKKRKLLIIADTSKEAQKAKNRQFITDDEEFDDEGSLLCYPVTHSATNKIPYVISILADKRNYFDPRKKALYKWMFKHFNVRICLEHSLLLIKSEANIK